MKKLLIVESPAKIKTISKFLGKDFKIMSTMGHIKDLPQKELGITFNKEIKLAYDVLEGKEKTIADICKEAGKSDIVFLAPDPDREGEIIAWHVRQEIEKVMKDKSKIYRIAFNEITKPAIEDAISHPSHIDEDKVAAQQARRILDRLVGYEVSPVLWVKVAKGLSAGRVQSVALKLICDREESIRNFKPEEYWTIHGLFDSGKKTNLNAELSLINNKKVDIKTEKDAQSVSEKIKKEDYKVESIKDSKRTKNPTAPFMTSTLQQAAYNALGFSVQKTMQLAQTLYEGIPLEDSSTPVALITYMRTDSLRISDVAIKSVRSYIDKNYGKDYLPDKSLSYTKAKDKAQDAHEAIRPIDVDLSPSKVSKFIPADAAKLYELIWKRFVACQMKPAIYAQRQVTITGGQFVFKLTGSTLLFDGYLKVYVEDDEKTEDKVIIPEHIVEGLALKLKEVNPKQHFTQPQPRFTEASLIKELDKEGIGRPSTYQAILRTIQARSYTELDTKKRFIPTELGMLVTKLLTENLPQIMNIKFTATMEEDLDKVAQGNLKRDKLVKDFYKDFEKELDAFRGEEAKRHVEPTDIDCPECGKHKLLIRFGKSGPFLGCAGYPECKFTTNFERLEDGTIKLVAAEQPKMLDEKCPNCGSQLRLMKGRFGEFISCSGYPKCKYIKPITAPFPCPQCNSAIIQRMWKGKKFWGCSGYPNCKFSIPGEIDITPCPACKSPYLMKKKTKSGDEFLACACGYKSAEE